MFEESLIESAAVLKTKRATTTMASLLVQLTFLAGLAIAPLMYVQALPPRLEQIVQQLLPPAPPLPATPQRVMPKSMTSEIIGNTLLQPRRIPRGIAVIRETETPPLLTSLAAPGTEPGVPGATCTSLPIFLKALPALPPRVRPQRVTVSGGVVQGLLIRRVEPVYPTMARQARIQGAVLLEAVIAKDGSIENLHVISGHPMLSWAAVEAVKQWRYRPYTLNGQPVEVETQITVNFRLSGG